MGKREFWPELDVLRGLAVIFMILNHAGVAWLKADVGGLVGTLSFVGGFAPVLFFFVTGFGYGLAHQVGKPANTRDVLFKAGILILADMFMRGGAFLVLGWDFLAFIAFSMLVLHALRGRRFGVVLALLAVPLLLGVRFGLGPILKRVIQDPPAWLNQVVGLQGIDGISYWFTPWLVYPLLGFLLGVVGRKYKTLFGSRQVQVMGGFLVLGLAVCGVVVFLVSRGGHLFRWGMMSLSYFVASIACLALSLAFVWGLVHLVKRPILINGLSLRGISSLAIVPIHYLALDLAARFLGFPKAALFYLAVVPLLMVVCFFAAKKTNTVAMVLARLGGSGLSRLLGFLVVLLGLVCVFFPGASWLFLVSFTAELVLCVMLAFSYK